MWMKNAGSRVTHQTNHMLYYCIYTNVWAMLKCAKLNRKWVNRENGKHKPEWNRIIKKAFLEKCYVCVPFWIEVCVFFSWKMRIYDSKCTLLFFLRLSLLLTAYSKFFHSCITLFERRTFWKSGQMTSFQRRKNCTRHLCTLISRL